MTSANDRLVGYAILVNGGSVNWFDATAAQDDIVELLASQPASGGAADPRDADAAPAPVVSVRGR